jgi:hypothetical protein
MPNCTKCGKPHEAGFRWKLCDECRSANTLACRIQEEKYRCVCFCHAQYKARICRNCVDEHPSAVPKFTKKVYEPERKLSMKEFKPAGVIPYSEDWWTLFAEHERKFQKKSTTSVLDPQNTSKST